MRKIMTWLLILTKRQLRNPFFPALIIMLPLTVLLSGSMSSKVNNQGYYAGIYIDKSSDNNSECAERIAESLVNSNSSIKFIRFDDSEDMINRVISEELISAYVLPGDLGEIMISGTHKQCILSYHIPASALHPAANELVYAELIREMGYYIMEEYMNTSSLFPDGDYIDEAYEYYEKYLTGDETISVIYEEVGTGNNIDNHEMNMSLSFPVRGIMCVLVFLAGMFGSVLYLKDSENGIFQTINKGSRRMLKIVYPLIPSFLLGMTMLISMMCSDIHKSFGYELAVMILYILCTTLYSVILCALTVKSRILSACLPVIMLCSIIFCPVFLNLERYVPAIRYIQKIFLPYYYLKMF